MRYYEQLVKLGCFTKNDVEHLLGSSEATYSLLQSYKKKGYIEQVKRNLYVTISMETKQPVAGRYRIASNIKSDSYITHHSAFEYYGYGNQVYYEVYVAAKAKFAKFEYDDVTYRYIAPRIDEGVVLGGDGVRVTDLERTVIDSINDFERIGGLEELLHCLELVPSLHEDKLLRYLKLYGKKFLYQKSGYLLEHYQQTFRLSDAFYQACAGQKAKSVRYLYRGIEKQQPVFNQRWQLFVPENLLDTIAKGGIYSG
jgi:predicted transcriptional regulator of viral defense system